MAFDLNTTVKNWGVSLGNGANALKYMVLVFEHVAKSNDATVVARLIDKARSKGDDMAARSVSYYVKVVWDGAQVTPAKDKKSTSIKLKGSKFKPEAMDILRGAVADGVSLRGTKLRQMFKDETETETETAPKVKAKAKPEVAPEAAPEAETVSGSGSESDSANAALRAVMQTIEHMTDEDLAKLRDLVLSEGAARAERAVVEPVKKRA